MKQTKSKSTDPSRQDVIDCIDRLIVKLRWIEQAARTADLRSVDVSAARKIAEELRLKLSKTDWQQVDWAKTVKCVVWLIEVAREIHSFLYCQQTSDGVARDGWRNHKTYPYCGWYLARRAC
jgi:hypothetical protein